MPKYGLGDFSGKWSDLQDAEAKRDDMLTNAAIRRQEEARLQQGEARAQRAEPSILDLRASQAEHARAQVSQGNATTQKLQMRAALLPMADTPDKKIQLGLFLGDSTLVAEGQRQKTQQAQATGLQSLQSQPNQQMAEAINRGPQGAPLQSSEIPTNEMGAYRQAMRTPPGQPINIHGSDQPTFGGALRPQMESPNAGIAQQAMGAQQRLDALPPGGMPLTSAEGIVNRVQQAEQALSNRQQPNPPRIPTPPAVQTMVNGDGYLMEKSRPDETWRYSIDENGKRIKSIQGSSQGNIDARLWRRQYDAQIAPSRRELEIFEKYERAKETWKKGEAVPPAYAEVAQNFIQMARGNTRFKADIDSALGGGSIAQRVWGALSRVATGSPSGEQIKDLDLVMQALGLAAASNISTVNANMMSDVTMSKSVDPAKVIGGPKVYGSIFIQPNGKMTKMKSREAALEAAHIWRSENDRSGAD